MMFLILTLFFWLIFGYLITVYLEENHLPEQEALIAGTLVGFVAALLWPATIAGIWVWMILKIVKKNEFIKRTSKRIVGVFE